MEAPSVCRLAVALQEQAARTPDRIAVRDRQRALTYAELDDAVGRLAARMLASQAELGECRVLPIVVGRDVGSIVAVQAAIRAGIAQVPIDPTLPAAAVANLINRIDSPRFSVVSDEQYAGLLPAGVRALPAFVDDREVAGPAPVGQILARLMFTSGSTGESKGVMTSWDSFNGYGRDPERAAIELGSDVRALGLSPFGFTAGFRLAIMTALGVSVTIVDPNAHSRRDVLDICDRDRITWLPAVPSLLSRMLDRWPDDRRLETVRVVRIIGEPLDWSTVAMLRRALSPDAVVINSYGASEVRGHLLSLTIDSSTPIGVGRVPMGRPPFGGLVRLEPREDDDPYAPSEIVAVGERVALGYWRNAELTAKSFGRDPDGTPFWRSGDLVREGSDGLLHYVGRRDSVVKINGKLVEPSEPERVLGTVDGIRRAVVLVQPSPRGGQRLVAHVEAALDAPTPKAVRAAVAAEVAPHLVPSILVRHEQLPLTSRGKVDRQALMAAEPQPWIE